MSKSNDIVVFHVQDAAEWSSYLMRLFAMNKTLRIKSMDLDSMEYENPPEVAMAVKESYLVIILASPDMLQFMADKTWFSEPFKQLHGKTTVVAVLCYVDSGQFDDAVAENYRASSSWKHYVIGTDYNDNRNMVADMMDIVDQSDAPPPPPPSRPERRKESKSSFDVKLKVIPTRVHGPQDDIVIALREEKKGTIQVSFNDPTTKYDTKKLNPYTVKLKAPDLAPGNYVIHIFQDAKEIYKTPFYYTAPQETAFHSVEYLSQALQCENKAALDRKLVDALETSIPEDDSLEFLFEKLKTTLSSGITKSKSQYPTMLHFAAANGLNEFCSCLLDVPGSLIAFQVENCDGRDPADLADVYNYPELAQYIRDFMETAYLADACDLYTHMAAGYQNRIPEEETETESFYMDMQGRNSSIQEEPEDPYSMALPPNLGTAPPPPLQPRATRLPPVPNRPRRQSADVKRATYQSTPVVGPSTDSAACAPASRPSQPTAPRLTRVNSERASGHAPIHDSEPRSMTLPAGLTPSVLMGIVEDEKALPRVAMGSTSQNELLEIMDGVKEGNFNPHEALMLFKAWQQRNGERQSKSFKQRQNTLRMMREEYNTVIDTVTQTADQMSKKTSRPGFFARLISKRQKTPRHVPQISDPIVSRSTRRGNTISANVVSGTRFSTLSTTSSSSSSSRDSTVSMDNTDPFSTSDESESEQRRGVTYRRQTNSTRSLNQEKRQSHRMEFLEQTDNMETLPPVPPRTYTRTDTARPVPQTRPPR
ncbi:phosphoinositide 3-kinase adapter protein 1-like isoform X1 [Haliotis rufescens]|uniref:phosphoinositide 3-kinase adapter protein 1-like isoform X1 n=1 Tax=Haliotis rufescens TaxID=6454 RepID=UPI001EB09CBB|nr:phosphoinositide 3-kinase adapter protein 1-like isoform X1 [Haliotis rufescens]XP_046380709.1 phosphoinositide 3-kinase adapter protein 1-like isoform X1 [Haliotis rufescens]